MIVSNLPVQSTDTLVEIGDMLLKSTDTLVESDDVLLNSTDSLVEISDVLLKGTKSRYVRDQRNLIGESTEALKSARDLAVPFPN